MSKSDWIHWSRASDLKSGPFCNQARNQTQKQKLAGKALWHQSKQDFYIWRNSGDSSHGSRVLVCSKL